MSSRYGRNQRRKHRDEIAALKVALKNATSARDHWLSQATTAEARAVRADEIAFQRFMRASGYLRMVLSQMADQMGAAAGRKLLGEFIFAISERQKSVTLTTDRIADRVAPVRTITLRLPPLEMRYALRDFEEEAFSALGDQ